MVILYALFCRPIYAAVPDDIKTNQVAWYDASDLNGDADHTNNPVGNTLVNRWDDKSGSGNHLQSSGNRQPVYLHNTLSADRHGVSFDGINDWLVDDDDIWTGPVDRSETFIVATTDRYSRSVLAASSSSNHRNRVTTHTSWGTGPTFFDHGENCCTPPDRIYKQIGYDLAKQYLWNFIANPNHYEIVRDVESIISAGTAGVYQTEASSKFALGGWPVNPWVYGHGGRIFESLHFQRTLSIAQRRILNSYLSAKWDKPFHVSASYTDVYQGDDAAAGDYDFFMGGIGRDGGTQSIGTSQGLTIENDSFLTADGKFVTAGVDYLLTSAPVGSVTLDIPSGYESRSLRTWYIDTTGSGGTVDLSFDLPALGMPSWNVYGLLYRAGTSGVFSEVATATYSSGQVTFNHLPLDGVYALGQKQEVDLKIDKSVDDASPNIGQLVTFTLTINNAGPSDANNVTIEDHIPAGFLNPVVSNAPAGVTHTITGNTINWAGLSVTTNNAASVQFTAIVATP